ncbi:MAG: site-specific integrase [Pseudomonadota bacterium]
MGPKKEKNSEGKMVKSGFVGVYSRDFLNHNGKPDQCFYITYRKGSQLVWEKIGHASEGYGARMAANLRSERIRSIRHGEELPKEKAKVPFFSEAMILYNEWSGQNKRDQNDKARYENHLKEFLEKKRMNEISSFVLEKIKSDLTKKDLAPATVKHCLQLIRAVYNKMISWEKYRGPNPAEKIKMPIINNRRERFLSFEEAQTLLKKLNTGSHTTYEVALVSLHTGLRAGEIFKLRRQDLDFQNGIIRIMDPKNKSSRAVYMTDQVKAILKTRLPGEPGDLVFLPRIHAKGQISRVSGFFQRAVDQMFNKGITDRRQRVVFHSLRHTFASWLATEGVPLLAIKELLGHKTLAMTERYAHLSPDVKREAVMSLEQGFNQKKAAVI